jgi:hypothetical protein
MSATATAAAAAAAAADARFPATATATAATAAAAAAAAATAADRFFISRFVHDWSGHGLQVASTASTAATRRGYSRACHRIASRPDAAISAVGTHLAVRILRPCTAVVASPV